MIALCESSMTVVVPVCGAADCCKVGSLTSRGALHSALKIYGVSQHGAAVTYFVLLSLTVC